MPSQRNRLATDYYLWARKLSAENTRLKREKKRLQKENVDLKQENDRLKEELAKLNDERSFLRGQLFKTSRQPSFNPRPRGKKPGTQGYGRPKPETITHQEVLTTKKCPHCQAALPKQPSAAYERIVEDIDLPPPRVKVTRYTIPRYWCKKCHKLVSPQPQGVLPHARFGLNALLYVLLARYRFRMTQSLIKDSLETFYGLKLSSGEVSQLLDRGALLFKQKWKEVRELIRTAQAVNIDETGWRIDGQRAWLWVFNTAKGLSFEIAPSRGKGIVVDALGEDFSGTRITDGYRAYQNLPGAHQVCWVHLIRRARELVQAQPDNKERSKLLARLRTIYDKINAFKSEPFARKKAFKVHRSLKNKISHHLLDETWSDPGCEQLINQMRRSQEALLTCILKPQVPPHNNAAERPLRPQVIMRKVFGGSRSAQGAQTHAINASILATLQRNYPQPDSLINALSRELETAVLSKQ
jgi:hypothetical protein